ELPLRSTIFRHFQVSSCCAALGPVCNPLRGLEFGDQTRNTASAPMVTNSLLRGREARPRTGVGPPSKKWGSSMRVTNSHKLDAPFHFQNFKKVSSRLFALPSPVLLRPRALIS